MIHMCIYITLAAVLALVLSTAGIYFHDWQYWGVLACAFGLYFCGLTQ